MQNSQLAYLKYAFQESCDMRETGFCYNVNGNIISTILPDYKRPEPTDKILDDSNEFVNGFKVVQLINGEYAYVRESDNKLLPFRYDIALNFNEYGLAMVGRQGRVTWIDTSFNYLNSFGEMVPDDNPEKLRGFEEMEDFSKGTIPLSKVVNFEDDGAGLCYVEPDKKFKNFYRYNGTLDQSSSYHFEYESTSFNEEGYAITDNSILFAEGVMIGFDDLLKICIDKGYLKEISEAVKQAFGGPIRALKK